MQNSVPVPHSISELFWVVVAIILTGLFGGGGFAAVWGLILNRRRPAAEVHESEARTAKTLAESRSIDLQTNLSAGDAVLRMVNQLAFAQMTIDQKNEVIERLENENQTYERQIQWAKGIFKVKGIPWDDQMK